MPSLYESHSNFSSYPTCPECGSVHRRLRLDVRRTDYRFEDRCQSEWHRAEGESREEFSDYLTAQDTLYQTAQRLRAREYPGVISAEARNALDKLAGRG